MSYTSVPQANLSRGDVRSQIASLVLDKVPPARIVSILTSKGFDWLSARDEVARAMSDPYLTVAVQKAAYTRRIERLLNIYGDLDAKSPVVRVDEVSSISESDFLANYYCRNRPVIVRDGASHWPIMQRWSMDYFHERWGHELVEYTIGDRRYTVSEQKAVTTMSHLIDQIREHGISNHRYLVATNFAFRGSLGAELEDRLPLEFLPSIDVTDPHVTRLWLGPRGTITPLHHDILNVVFVQVVGRKRFMLAPSYEICRLDARNGTVFSDVDPVAIDAAAHPEALDVQWLTVSLQPADVLFIPIGWWHWVYALTESISLNFAEFPVGRSIDRWEVSK